MVTTMRGNGLGYAVNDNISLNVGQTAYGDEGEFGGFAGNMGNGRDGSSWA